MDLAGFSDTQLQVKEAVGRICTQFPDEYWALRDQDERYPHELHAALAKDGWIGIALPEELGGAGLGISEATMMLQTVSQSGAGIAGAQSIHANVYATQPVAKFATKEQRHRMLPKLISGEWKACFGVTEPSTGLETLKLRTRAVRDGDGYRITGQKIWISSAQVASKCILLARTTPLEEVKKSSEGLSLFFIDMGRGLPGLELRKIKKMGGKAVDANEIFFDDYRVPANTLIGEEGQGFKIVLHGMNAERCLLASEALGLGYAALEKATKYARERTVFGRPIGQNQGIQHPLAMAYMNLEAAKLSTYHAAKLYDVGDKGSDVPAHSLGIACNAAKFLAAEAAFTACERAVLTLGGLGYAAEYHVERYLRECFVPRIAPVSKEMIMNYFTFRQPVITGKRAAIARAAYEAGFDCSYPSRLLHLIDAVVLAENKFGYPDRWDGRAAFQSTIYPDTWTAAHASRKEKVTAYDDDSRAPSVPAFVVSATDIVRNLTNSRSRRGRKGATNYSARPAPSHTYARGANLQPLGERSTNKRTASSQLPENESFKRPKTEGIATPVIDLTMEENTPLAHRTRSKVSGHQKSTTNRPYRPNEQQRAAAVYQAEAVAAGTGELLHGIITRLKTTLLSIDADRDALRERWEVDRRLQLLTITDHLKMLNGCFEKVEKGLKDSLDLIEGSIL
ncbi:MAG: hypothetical protein Q9219_003852 [cf. Caloplaca sp. 3 TL-2023]